MQINDCYYLGTITKAHGYKGELNVHLDTDDPAYYNNLESIFIEKNGLLVPFFLSKAKTHKTNHLLIKLEDTSNPEQFIGRDVYLPLSHLPDLGENKFYYHQVKGYHLIDAQNNTTIGTIKDVRTGTAQDLFEVEGEKSQNQILIPVIDEWIKEVNHQNKQIKVHIPDGLLDIF